MGNSVSGIIVVRNMFVLELLQYLAVEGLKTRLPS